VVVDHHERPESAVPLCLSHAIEAFGVGADLVEVVAR
jgi:hypothetical protein